MNRSKKKKSNKALNNKQNKSNTPKAQEQSASNSFATKQATANDGPSDIVIVYKSELDYMSRCIMDCPRIETGGQLFGYWTSSGVPVVLYAIGPGRNANHQPSFFNQDLSYLETVGKILIEEFGLQHMGEWHSHHQLGLAQPSSHDSATIYNNMERHNIEHFLLCIGNCTDTTSTVNAFNYRLNAHYYKEARWEIKNMESPFRPVIDKALQNMLIHPKTKEPSLCKMKVASISNGIGRFVNTRDAPAQKQQYPTGYWLNNKKNNELLQKFIETIQNCGQTVKPAIDRDRLVHLLIGAPKTGKNYDMKFPLNFPKESPITTTDAPNGLNRNTCWEYSEGKDIATVFSNYIKAQINDG